VTITDYAAREVEWSNEFLLYQVVR